MGKENLLLEYGESIEHTEEFCYAQLWRWSWRSVMSEGQVCLEEIQGVVSNTDSMRSIS